MKLSKTRPILKRRPSQTSDKCRWSPPKLRLTPYAWAKLLYLRDLGPTEVGGFGITPHDDLLLVEDFVLVRQVCSEVTVRLDDEAVADFFDEQVDQGRKPDQFGRIWIHTHPGNSPTPSNTDEATFDRCFGEVDWSLMFIIARGGPTYARLQFRVGPGGQLTMPVEIDFRHPFPGADAEDWEAEYERCVSAAGNFFHDCERLKPNRIVERLAADELELLHSTSNNSSILWPQEINDVHHDLFHGSLRPPS